MLDWFKGLNKWVRVILLVIPFVGWIIELAIRWTEFFKDTSNVTNLVIAIVTIFCGWPIAIVDIVMIILDKPMFLLNE